MSTFVKQAIDTTRARAQIGNGRWLPLNNLLPLAVGHDSVHATTSVWYAAQTPVGDPIDCVIIVHDTELLR